MQPRDVVRIGILASLGTLALAVAVWLLSFAFRGGSDGGSPFALLVLVGGLLVLVVGVALVGGAGADALWARLERWRERQR